MGWTRNLRLRQLQMFERLCEVGNISQVAAEFNLTQPALSKWLHDFEANIGAPLFKRHARGMEPLPIAIELARHASGIVSRLDRARTSIEQMKHVATRQIAVGVSPMVAIVLLPQIVRAFHRKNPATFIQIVEGTLDSLIAQLRLGELDVVVGRIEQGGAPAGFHHQTFADVSTCLAVCESHPLAHQNVVTWEEARAYPWIAPPAISPIREQMELAFQALGIASPPVLVESSHVATTARLIPGTDFVAPMAKSLAKSLGLAHTLNVPWPSLDMAASIGALWRPEDEALDVLRGFIECAREASGPF